MSRPDLDIPELHLALTAAAGQRPAAHAPRTSVLRARNPRTSAVRARAVAVLCVAAVALAGVFAVASPATTPDPGASVAGSAPAAGAAPAAPARSADVESSSAPNPGLLRCALASIPRTVLPATVVIRGAGSC